MTTQRIKDLPAATLALTDRIPLESISDNVTRKFTPSDLFTLLYNNAASYPATASLPGFLTNAAQSIAGNKTFDGLATADNKSNKLVIGYYNGSFLNSYIKPSSGSSGLIFQTPQGNDAISLVSLNAGAHAAFVVPAAAAGGAPAFTTRTNGLRFALSSQINGTTVDPGLGVETDKTSPWISIGQANSAYAFNIYAGQTKIGYFRGDGLLDNTGTVRATGSTTPSSGAGVEIVYDSGGARGLFQVYDRGAATYRSAQIHGSDVRLAVNGVTTFTAAATVNTHTVPEQMKTFTVATGPASPAVGLHAYFTDAGGNGPCGAYGNGSVWKRCDNTSTTVA